MFDISVGDHPPSRSTQVGEWEQRPGGIWLLRKPFDNNVSHCVTGVNILFGTDAIDTRPRWTLSEAPLTTSANPGLLAARLSIHRGRQESKLQSPVPIFALDYKFRMLQISDTHMVTGPDMARAAMDASRQELQDVPADPRTIAFISNILDVEKPDLVVLTGDQLHYCRNYGYMDAETGLYKLLAPIIERATPFAVVFGNHDDEGNHSLSRKYHGYRHLS